MARMLFGNTAKVVPVGPRGPVAPVVPTGPVFPVGPVALLAGPVKPCGPVEPRAPVGPVTERVGPVSPVGPLAPVLDAPVGPVGAMGSNRVAERSRDARNTNVELAAVAINIAAIVTRVIELFCASDETRTAVCAHKSNNAQRAKLK